MGLINRGMFGCCLQGIQPCKCKGGGHWWIGNQVFRWLGLRKEWDHFSFRSVTYTIKIANGQRRQQPPFCPRRTLNKKQTDINITTKNNLRKIQMISCIRISVISIHNHHPLPFFLTFLIHWGYWTGLRATIKYYQKINLKNSTNWSQLPKFLLTRTSFA